MNEALKQYEIGVTDFWQNANGDGYEVMGYARQSGWHAIARWGRDGYALGGWPMVMVFAKTEDDQFYMAYYVEGDVMMYACPSLEVRNQIIDEIAFYHWNYEERAWVAGYDTVDVLPAELRGPEREQ